MTVEANDKRLLRDFKEFVTKDLKGSGPMVEFFRDAARHCVDGSEDRRKVCVWPMSPELLDLAAGAMLNATLLPRYVWAVSAFLAVLCR